MNIRLLPVLLLAAVPAPAQILVETFDGPNLPANWAVRSGTWSITNGRISVASTGHNYMTIPGTNLLNCAMDVDVYWTGSGIQAGGVCARHGGTSTESCVMVKAQANSATPNGLDRIYAYERPGGSVSTVLSPTPTKTRIRMLCIGTQAFLQLDTNQDGTFDTTQAPLPISTHNTSGEVGIIAGTIGSAAAQLDNFALFDAVLVQTGIGTANESRPRIGTTYSMTLYTQATSVTPFLCAMSLSNGGTTNGNLGGIPIGGGRSIPLGLDPIFNLSLAVGGTLGLNGVTDASGVGNPKIAVPNLPALVSLAVHVAAVTPNGPVIGNISNNHRVVFEP
ncbi:MAG: hypothetical protein H6837_13625 [Planctomycetes bacterium]|nr:hypothetical protein [Planctomycetota bacterium]